MNERVAPPSAAIFSKNPAGQPAAQPERRETAHAIDPNPPKQGPLPEKEEFKDPFAIQNDLRSQAETKNRAIERMAASETDAAQKAANALNNQGELSAGVDDGITADDLKLAEQLIFKGYAEKNVEMEAFPGKKFTICSTNAEELSIIDDIAFDMVKNIQTNSDGTVDLPENHVRTMRNALFVALSYRGVDGVELCTDAVCHLNTLKKAIFKTNELYNEGDIKKGDELKVSLKRALVKRATAVKRLATPLIDFLSGEKYRFDAKMAEVMNKKGILPKS